MMTEPKTDDPDLERLRDAHGDRYYISRVGSLWVATLRRDDGTEPTIIEDTPEKLTAHLKAPTTWGQRPPYPKRPR